MRHKFYLIYDTKLNWSLVSGDMSCVWSSVTGLNEYINLSKYSVHILALFIFDFYFLNYMDVLVL